MKGKVIAAYVTRETYAEFMAACRRRNKAMSEYIIDLLIGVGAEGFHHEVNRRYEREGTYRDVQSEGVQNTDGGIEKDY